MPEASLPGADVHQVEIGPSSTAMASSLEGKAFGKGSCWKAASLTALSMVEEAALIWVLAREELGIRAGGEEVTFQFRTTWMAR